MPFCPVHKRKRSMLHQQRAAPEPPSQDCFLSTGAGRGKDMSNITGHRGKDMSSILQAEDGKENGQLLRARAGQRRKKRRRLNDLDSDSTVDEEESEEEFCLSER